MNKTELIDAITETSGHHKSAVTAILGALIQTVQSEVAAGRDVQVTGFGTFKRGLVPAGSTKDIHSGRPVSYAASWTPKFKAGEEFKAAVKATPVAA